MKENKKIHNATKNEYDGIKFLSVLERSCYKKLKEAGLDFSYESEKIILWEGFKPSFYIIAPKKLRPGKYTKELYEQTKKIINITYTPDFIVIKDNYKIYFDVKGNVNDVYPIKKKMFLKTLEERDDGYTYMFIEPHSVAQMKEAINLIQKL